MQLLNVAAASTNNKSFSTTTEQKTLLQLPFLGICSTNPGRTHIFLHTSFKNYIILLSKNIRSQTNFILELFIAFW